MHGRTSRNDTCPNEGSCHGDGKNVIDLRALESQISRICEHQGARTKKRDASEINSRFGLRELSRVVIPLTGSRD